MASEKLKRNELKALRGRQVTLVTKYASALENRNYSLLGELKEKFIENLSTEIKLDHFMGLEVTRYPLFFDNLLEALGYQVYMGDMPTVSGTQPYERYHIACDSSKILVVGDYPSSLFGSIADIQPLTTKPILGISHTTWTDRNNSNDRWETDRFKLSVALGIGRLKIKNSKIILQGIRLDPNNDNEKLRKIANDVGLTSFLSLPVDNLPIYGTFRAGERKLLFQEKNIKKILIESQKAGHELIDGSITNFAPNDALNNPNLLLDSLHEKDYVSTTDRIEITKTGKRYIRDHISYTPQEAALFKAADAAILNPLRGEFTKITDQIIKSEKNVTNAIAGMQVEIEELRKDKYKPKYLIGTPSISPIQFQIEIPIREMSEEEILKKITELRDIISKIPASMKTELKHSIAHLTNIPSNIKTRLLGSFK